MKISALFLLIILCSCNENYKQENMVLKEEIGRNQNTIDSLQKRCALLKSQIGYFPTLDNPPNYPETSNIDNATVNYPEIFKVGTGMSSDSKFSLWLLSNIATKKLYTYACIKYTKGSFNDTNTLYTDIRSITKYNEELHYMYLDDLRAEVRSLYGANMILSIDVYFSERYKDISIDRYSKQNK